VILAQQRGKAELIAAAQFRRGYDPEENKLITRISLNGLKRYADSNEVFQLAKKAESKEKSIDIWITKNTRELAKPTSPPIAVSEEKKSTVDVIPKGLAYSIERSSFHLLG
jgi:hypothetical protein